MAYTVIPCCLYEESGLFFLYGAVCYSLACQFIPCYYVHYPPMTHLRVFLSFGARKEALNKANLRRVHFCAHRTGTHNINSLLSLF